MISETHNMENVKILHTQITDNVRVSSAAIFYPSQNRFQVETIVFSKDDRQPFRMFIHGSIFGEIEPGERLFEVAKTFNRRASRLLSSKLLK